MKLLKGCVESVCSKLQTQDFEKFKEARYSGALTGAQATCQAEAGGWFEPMERQDWAT
jgi:hypothetical protein